MMNKKPKKCRLDKAIENAHKEPFMAFSSVDEVMNYLHS